ncbi:MAG TPA: VOC family protein, partial [Anaerolineaceae bacterium]|nr:VOC family protein [Anaerolineaceae bacterium]
MTGLHHVTAITGRAPQNLDFYTRVLGLRLVKKTVNQDDISAYHLFYADAHGNPGTDLTFFDWPDSVGGRAGAGTVGQIGLRVNGMDALESWTQRLSQAGVTHSGIVDRNG